MRYLYIDDSVHDKAGFIIVAFVYVSEDPEHSISEIITNSGLDPSNFEFKSSAKYLKASQRVKVREGLRDFLSNNCGIALAVMPRQQRSRIGVESLKAFMQFAEANNILKRPCKVYFDQGMFMSRREATDSLAKLNIEGYEFNFEQDSHLIKGIQVADLAAHTASIILKEKLGLVTKKVLLGKDFGYEPEIETGLGFELWAPIRNCFFHDSTPAVCTGDRINDCTVNVEPRGLYVSELCDSTLAAKARSVFGTVYLGCLH